ncbi:hypothetical protein [Alkalimonas amylolytica]|uniref:Uncharacterized protein n=1 Tax=Alkalimonas amylolytica TaxID=152573 RepID=A0A1H4AVW4_ALKAM|nr:hypothetical protein [Alkalimonas amylolytica]SEA39994.1 hypothetical protein SAMN04488051_10350 [Alkalimonas amylolytica]
MQNSNLDEQQLAAQQKTAELESLCQQDKLAELNKEFEALRPKAWIAWGDVLLVLFWYWMLYWLAPEFFDQPWAFILMMFVITVLGRVGYESKRINKRIDLLKAMLQK